RGGGGPRTSRRRQGGRRRARDPAADRRPGTNGEGEGWGRPIGEPGRRLGGVRGQIGRHRKGPNKEQTHGEGNRQAPAQATPPNLATMQGPRTRPSATAVNAANPAMNASSRPSNRSSHAINSPPKTRTA